MLLLLICCAVTVFLWVRSYVRIDVLFDTVMPRQGAHWYWRNRTVTSRNGGVLLIEYGALVNTPRWADNFVQPAGKRYHEVHMPGQRNPGEPFARSHWFEFDRRRNLAPMGSFSGPEVLHLNLLTLRVPYWLPTLLTGLPPAVWLVHRLRKMRRAREGRCLHCGYDLRASPEQCPECGAVPGQPDPATA